MKNKIVMIDDDESLVQMTEVFLTSQGWEFRGAGSGAAGLGLIAEFGPDAILLDINLPDMDGFAICAKLKADSATRGIPLLLVSGEHKKAVDILKGLSNSQADGYMVKPVDLRVLRAKLEAVHKPVKNG